MRVRDDSLLRVTYALRKPDTAGAAIETLRGHADPIAVEGLFELIVAAPASRLVVAALNAIGEVDHPLVVDVLRIGMRSKFAPARLAAVQVAQRRKLAGMEGECVRMLREDESWPNRRAAILALAETPSRDEVLFAADDPHWRVRHALIRLLMTWRPVQLKDSLRSRGVALYLEWAKTGSLPANWTELEPLDPCVRCPFWDWDPAVLAVKLARLSRRGRADAIDVMPFLVGHEEERVWKLAVETIRDAGEPRHYADAIAWLDDPRNGAGPAIERLFDGLDGDCIEDVARFIVCEIEATPAQLAWVLRQLGDNIPLDPTEAWQQRCGEPAESDAQSEDSAGEPEAFAEQKKLPAHLRHVAGRPASSSLCASDSAGRTPSLFSRALELTPERAAELLADPHRETSWHVLEVACRLAKRPLWDIAPEHPWVPPERITLPATPIDVTPTLAPHRALLGRERLEVSRVGVTGHYLLPAEGFAKAAEAGVNWFFWEPNYATLTDFSARLAPRARGQFHFVAGTFEAEGKRIRTDVERALRMLQVDQLGLFLIFWVQSWDRLTDDVRDTVRRLKEEGKAAVVGLSSHNRPLLLRAMEEGWNPVMARHSAAHRGAEEAVFPKAAELGTTLLTFNNLCYGRMLQPIAGLAPPDPADCYRYSLSFPGVRACWSAPSTVEQLDANLRALHDPELSAERREYLERFGAKLYEEETVFRRLVRML